MSSKSSAPSRASRTMGSKPCSRLGAGSPSGWVGSPTGWRHSMKVACRLCMPRCPAPAAASCCSTSTTTSSRLIPSSSGTPTRFSPSRRTAASSPEESLKKLGEMPVTLRFLVEGEEEIGSKTFEKIAHKHADKLRADGCLWESGASFDEAGRPTLQFGCRGLLYVQLRVKLLGYDQHSGLASIYPSAAMYLVRRSPACGTR